MKVNDKIRFLRESKNWSQEETASKLGMSTTGYAKIERGESRLTMNKLEQIVEIFNTDILELLSLGERNIIYFQDSESNHSLNIINPTSSDLIAEITQLKQAIAHKEEVIAMQKMQIETLQNLVDTLKKA